MSDVRSQMQDVGQINELRTEVKQLRNAINKIGDCPHSGHCPVRDELRKQSESE